MSSTPCRAKNPSTCQYHGASASSTTRVLRDTMLVARSVYKAAADGEKFEAYYNLQESEEAYYGTEEGRASLIEYINTSDNSSNKENWLQILDRADKRREFVETNVATRSDHPSTQKEPLVFNQNMRVENLNGRKYVTLADGAYSDGIEYAFDWDQTSGQILYEEVGDTDSMRILGFAQDVGAAKNVCENWYNRNQARAT